LTVAPAGPRLIDRGDLVAALDRAATRTVTIISASAGSGKTSLLRAWACGPGQPGRLAVLQVRRDQHDAQQFWLALLDAVRHASATTGRAEPPTATLDFNGSAMVDRVLSELAEAPGGVTLVVDDLHELASPDAVAELARLLTNLPPDVHAVLTTRHDVRLGLHRLRLAGELAETNAAGGTARWYSRPWGSPISFSARWTAASSSELLPGFAIPNESRCSKPGQDGSSGLVMPDFSTAPLACARN
jgi:LuxR family maltose regulon positive regulatory protein